MIFRSVALRKVELGCLVYHDAACLSSSKAHCRQNREVDIFREKFGKEYSQ